MSQGKVRKSSRFANAGWPKRETNGTIVEPSDYEDEVTQEDIDRLHAHVRENFGDMPADLVTVSAPAW